jgi:hypothetical protein
MIVSHKHKFIYVKSFKTASSSIERMLAPHLGEEDEFALDIHDTPTQVKKKVGDEVWNSYFKFTSVRNPWDAMVSLYFFSGQRYHVESMWKGRTIAPKHFRDFVQWNLTGDMPVNKEFYRLDGELDDWADMYARFEHLEADCNAIMTYLELPFDGVPRTNIGTARPKGLHYSMMYDPWARDAVGKVFEEENKWFEYSYEHWIDIATRRAQ